MDLLGNLKDTIERFAQNCIFLGEKAFYKGKYMLFPVSTAEENQRNIALLKRLPEIIGRAAGCMSFAGFAGLENATASVCLAAVQPAAAPDFQNIAGKQKRVEISHERLGQSEPVLPPDLQNTAAQAFRYPYYWKTPAAVSAG